MWECGCGICWLCPSEQVFPLTWRCVRYGQTILHFLSTFVLAGAMGSRAPERVIVIRSRLVNIMI